MTRLTLPPGLDASLAAAIRPGIDRLTEQVALEGARRAPDGKTWISMRDERVRHSHVNTDGQTIPANLDYEVGPDEKGRTATMPYPRYPQAPVRETAGCRCSSVPLPGDVGQHVHAQPAYVAGTRVVGRVQVEYPRIVESHDGLPFMTDALRAVAERMR